MPIGTGLYGSDTNKDLFKKLIRDLFNTTDRTALVEHEKAVKTIKTGDIYEREYRTGGLGYPAEVAEGQPIPTSTPINGTTKDFTQVKFGHGFRVTFEVKKFNKWSLVEMLTRDLKKTMEEARDVNVMRIYNYHTATTYAAGFDTLALASDTHTCLNGDTYDNLTTTALSTTSLEAAWVYFSTLKDDAGHTYFAEPKKLLVPPQLWVTANQLTRSSNVPFEISNTKNVIPDWGITPTLMRRLTDSTDYFVIGDTGDKNFGPRVYISMEPDLITHDAYDDSRDTVVNSMMFFKYGFTDPRLVYCANV